MAIAPGECYKCREPIDVIALILPIPFEGVESEDPEDQYSLLSWVEDINDEALEVIQTLAPLWRLGKSYTLEAEVFMNHCASCDAHQGDFFLRNPDGPFFPMAEAEAQKIRLIRVDVPIELEASNGTVPFAIGPDLSCHLR